MGHRGGAEAGLVGEHPTGESLLHGRHDGVAKDAPSHCLKAEGAGDNGCQSGGNLGNTQQNNSDAGQDIEAGHKGDQIGGHLPDALDAADDHHSHNNCQKNTGNQRINSEQSVHGAGNFTGLGDISNPKRGEAPKQGKQNSQGLPPPAQPLFDVIHGAAPVGAALICLPVLDG